MKKLILYGAGGIGGRLAVELTLNHIQIECFCDSDPNKCGKRYCGYPVKTAGELRRVYPAGSFWILLAMRGETAAGAREDLVAGGLFTDGDFYDKGTDPLGLLRFIPPDDPPPAPRRLERNFLRLDAENEAALKKGLMKHYFHAESCAAFQTGHAARDLSEHLYGRLKNDRRRVVPWLDSLHRLAGASVLEIGCGTGASTVALCEQGAEVTAMDVSGDAIEAAKIRLRAYGLHAEFALANAADLLEELPGRRFDLIIFFASLEHMTFEERIKALRAAFQMLQTGGLVVLVETPNRLWYMDEHTSWEPFYNWLPDDLSMEYAKFTPREGFNRAFETARDGRLLARWGRGVSYHEIALALGGAARIQVAGNLRSFLNEPQSILSRILKILGPAEMDEGFYDASLDIAMKKPSV